MPRKKSILEPVKLRVVVDCELHHRLIRLCGRKSNESRRIVKMGEMLRELLDKAADRELAESCPSNR
jgi:hypothetical protein